LAYARQESSHYQLNRTKQQPSVRHKLRNASAPAPAGTSTSDYMAANIADVSNFLAKYLTSKERILVQPYPEGEFSTFKKDYAGFPYDIIIAPEWKSYGLKLPNFDKYRVYREGIWHETDHANYSPAPLYAWGSNNTQKFMINILEDRRVEDTGVQRWPGYVPERIHTQAYFYAVRPDVSTIYDPNEPADSQKNKQARIEAFLQRMLLGKVKGQLPPDQMKIIEDTAQFAERKLKPISLERADPARVMTDMEALTLEAIKQLDVAPTKDKNGKSSDDGMGMPDYNETSGEKAAKGKSQSQIEKGMEEFFKEKEKDLGGGGGEGEGEEQGQGKGKESGGKDGKGPKDGKDGKQGKKDQFGFTGKDVQNAQKGSSDARAEYTNVAKNTPIDPALASWKPAIDYGPTAPFRDTNFMNHMKTELEKWIKGYEEIRGSSGSRFKVKQWIRDPEQAFVTRLRKSVKGNKVLVLADFSGSTNKFQDQYKRALISGLETLDKVGIKTGLFIYGTDFTQVKRFEEPRWTNVHAAKTAALADHDMTATGTAYSMLEEYVKRHRPDVFITLTDGLPNQGVSTDQEVARLKRQTRMIAFGIGDENLNVQLKKFGYNSTFAVPDVSQIPKKLVKTIIGE
jgi:hypothetical protein